jgi:iron complex outermembrane receptor protein
MNRKSAFWATTALFTGLLVSAGTASAQSTGTEATETTVDDVVVVGQRGPRNIDGAIVAETVGKTRSSITQEYIQTQPAGQTILQSLNLIPGVNFYNADPYGSSGGNIRLRGFDGNRVSLTFDGIPLNDTGNYATYTNQQLDPELIERATVNQGTTDVDSPTASATGGTINYTSRRPASDPGGWIQASVGDFNYTRFMALVDTGEVGPWGTSAWFAFSRQDYDKFKGEGFLRKEQYNVRVYQPLGDNGDFLALSGHYNENRNNNYNGPSLRTATGFCDVAMTVVCNDQVEDDPRGWDVDFETTYVAPTFRNGVADNDTNGTNYFGLRVNPSNTGNIRGNARFTLAEGLILTVDPSFQYVLANGGTQQAVLSETDALLRGTFATGGVDLNGDGDTLDRVRVMTPSNTNTHRYGLNTSLIWDLDDNHRLRAAYAYDRGRHRQYGQYGFVNFTNPSEPRFVDWFGGRNQVYNRVVNRDGYALQSRDRLSYAELNQFSLEYRGLFLNDALTVNLGVRAPFFKRELNQYCFSQNSSSNVLCTSELPNATLANGNVTFASRGATQYIAPYSREVEYEDLLPNVGVTYRFDGGHSVYGSYAETLSAPRTDSLYAVRRLADNSVGNPTVQPETAQTFDIGYRYSSATVVGSLAGFFTNYDNRIVNTFDEDLNTFVDRNVGSVELMGFEGALGWSPTEALTLYGSVAYLDGELQEDYRYNSAGAQLPTKGKKLVETPDWTASFRASYTFSEMFSAGVQAKYTGERWITDVNDLADDAFTIVDLDARIDFTPWGYEDTYLQFNVTNVFDENYYAGLGTRASATPGQLGYSRPFATTGAPRTWMATLRVGF